MKSPAEQLGIVFETWTSVSLGEIFDIGSSKRVLQRQWKQSGVPFYRAREVVKLAKFGSVDNELFISEQHYSELERSHGVPQSGDLMVSAVGTLGACYVVQPDDRFYFKDASVLQFRPTVEVEPKFFQYLFLSSAFLREVKKSDGATVGTLTISRAKALLVNLPALEEQKRIVAVLDKAFAALDNVRTLAEANLADAEELFEVGLDALIAKHGANGQATSLGAICSFENGDRGKNYPGRKAFVPSGVAFINAGHINSGVIDWEGMNYIPEEHFHRLGNGKVLENDLLFCLRGSLGKFGKVDRPGLGAIASSLVIVRAGQQVLTDFLGLYFKSKTCANMVAKYAGGAAQPNLSAGDLKKFEITLPRKDAQERAVAEHDELWTAKAELEHAYREKAKSIDDLRQSILQKAFSGELT